MQSTASCPSINEQREWKNDVKNDESFLAYIDILGFSELIGQRSLNDIVNVQSKFRFLLELTTGQTLKHLKKTNFLHFSDSALIWTLDTSSDSIREIVFATSHLACVLLRRGLLFRGAITAGELFVNKQLQIVVGSALSLAAHLERSQSWCGTIVHENVVEKIDEFFQCPRDDNVRIIPSSSSPLRILWYDTVPMKRKRDLTKSLEICCVKKKPAWCLDWITFFQHYYQSDSIRELIGHGFNRNDAQSLKGKPRQMCDDTLAFFRYVQNETK